MDRLIIFTHIEKTAGTSFKETLIRPNVPADRYLHCKGIKSFRAGLKNDPLFVTSHTPYGLHWFTSRKVEYITFLRDPIDRAVSHYYFVRESRSDDFKHRHYDYANSVGLVEFCQNRTFQNRQTRFLAGLVAHRTYDQIQSATFEKAVLNQAIKHLRSRYVCFGLQERFDDSLALFRYKLGWNKKVEVERQKKSQKRPRMEELDEETIAALRRCNALDLRLYEVAQKRFDKMFVKSGLASE